MSPPDFSTVIKILAADGRGRIAIGSAVQSAKGVKYEVRVNQAGEILLTPYPGAASLERAVEARGA